MAGDYLAHLIDQHGVVEPELLDRSRDLANLPFECCRALRVYGRSCAIGTISTDKSGARLPVMILPAELL